MPDGVDVSSYNRPALPSTLDIVGKLGGLQQQKQQIESGALTIDKQKLDLMNQQYGYLIRELNSTGPNPTANQLDVVSKNAVKMGLIKPDMYSNFIRTMPTNPAEIPAFRDSIATRLATTNEAAQFHYGSYGYNNTGNSQIPVRTTPRGGIQAVGTPIATQPNVQTEVRNPVTNESEIRGPRPPIVPPGMAAGPPNALPTAPANVAMPPPVGTPNAMYEAYPQPATTAVPTPRPRPVQPLPVQQPPTQAVTPDPGLRTGMSPLFEAGKGQLVEDQNTATAKLTAIKPALQALPLLKDLTTGIGTDTYNKATAALSNLGLLPKGMTDKTATYQEISKKLAAYVATSPLAARSDAAQTLSEAASPNPKSQINPALIKLTKDAIILDRVQAARAGAFEGNDYAKYGEHRSSFPAKIDERAFGLDLMEPKERQTLLDDMHKKQNTFEGKKFWNSLGIVKRQGLIDTAQ